MIPLEGGRVPCDLCGEKLYYAEQRQTLCWRCAMKHGISRLCDRPDADLDAMRRMALEEEAQREERIRQFNHFLQQGDVRFPIPPTSDPEDFDG